MKMRRTTKMIRMKRIKARVLSIWKSWINSPKTEGAAANNACPCCGASVYVPRPRTTVNDVAVTILCSILLLAIAISTAWATEQWMERASQKVARHLMIWREPIESWNQ